MLDTAKTTKLVLDKNERIAELEQENRKLKEERDFFKEQAILWRKDWKVAYEEKRKLEDKLGSLEK